MYMYMYMFIYLYLQLRISSKYQFQYGACISWLKQCGLFFWGQPQKIYIHYKIDENKHNLYIQIHIQKLYQINLHFRGKVFI